MRQTCWTRGMGRKEKVGARWRLIEFVISIIKMTVDFKPVSQ